MKAIELFAGAGGAALGLEAAGVHHLALCEWDADACATLRAAGLGPVVEGDVRDLDAIASSVFLSESDAWRRAGDLLLDSSLDGEEWCLEREALAMDLWEKSRRLDLLWSSWPCTPWTVSGRRKGLEERRGHGWKSTVAALDRFRPRWFLGENVRGLLHHSKEGHPDPSKCPRCYLDAVILAQLRERFDYCGVFELRASNFGVPQARRRLFVWAGPRPITPPRATHGIGMFGKPVVTMVDALGISLCFTTGNHRDGRPIRPVKGPSPPVLASMWRDRTPWKRAGTPFVHDPQPRRLTVKECATLQGLPDGYPLQGHSMETLYKQVGNAVPPKLAQVVVEAVLEADRRHQNADRAKPHHHGILGGIVENAHG